MVPPDLRQRAARDRPTVDRAIVCLTVRNALPQWETHIRVGLRLGLERAATQALASFEKVANEQ
jgi:hypothetical protein